MNAGETISRSMLFTVKVKDGLFVCRFPRSASDLTAKASCA